MYDCRRWSMLSAFRAITADSTHEFYGSIPIHLVFPNRQYKLQFTSKLKKRQTLEQCWEFWNNRIFEHWQIIENLAFFKECKGLDELGLDCWELYALILTITDPLKRLKVLQSLRDGTLEIKPVFPFPYHWNQKSKATYNMIIGKKEMRKFWLLTNELAIRVDVPDKYIKDFMNASFSMLSKNASAEEQKPPPPVEEEATPYQPVISREHAIKVINSRMTPKYIDATPEMPRKTNLFKHLLPTPEPDTSTLGLNLELTQTPAGHFPLLS